ncbi:unnamed protein product [Cylicocyclus nassatus]|uniref:Uncharacterized protein n=1 Tax=Cylicocyclus nassatus TaxID=53992 RepID=A0AA36DSH5_CYLNA|nr:unnamed protein product [Cylicocyclus nassatus]
MSYGSGGAECDVHTAEEVHNRYQPPKAPEMNNCSTTYSARLRSRMKQPVYTSDKRAKFTQRESKKWIRFVTVLGYIFFVSLPAISLSIYYVYIWDPGYINKFPPEVFNSSNNPVYIAPVVPIRPERDTSNSQRPSGLGAVHDEVVEQLCPNCKRQNVDLATILAEGTKSMETSVESSNTPTPGPDLRIST